MKIQEIFTGVSGECGGFRQGSWCAFVRLAGCNLRCSWCDTLRAQRPSDGNEMDVAKIFSKVERMEVNQVLITGGEPFVQEHEVELLVHSLRTVGGYDIQIETNGSFKPSSDILNNACCVFDYKLSSSGMSDKMMPVKDFAALDSRHWIKFVIASEKDYQEAVNLTIRINRQETHNIAFSACPPAMTHNDLFQRMKKDYLTHIVLSVQIHKLAELKEC